MQSQPLPRATVTSHRPAPWATASTWERRACGLHVLQEGEPSHGAAPLGSGYRCHERGRARCRFTAVRSAKSLSSRTGQLNTETADHESAWPRAARRAIGQCRERDRGHHGQAWAHLARAGARRAQMGAPLPD
jgi:hypothetical protein